MVWFPFRKNHFFKALERYSVEKPPADLFLQSYFRNNRSLGAKDRKYIGDLFYKAIRFERLLDSSLSKEAWFTQLENLEPDAFSPKEFSSPFLWEHLEKTYGEKEAYRLAKTSVENAPVTTRVNTLKTTRNQLLEKWGKSARPTPFSQEGIVYFSRAPLTQFKEFKDGYFEMQDEGSQLLADLVDPKGNAQVLDYCAGSGGKTLAFAKKLEGKGQIYLYDIREKALQRAKRRLRRAGIQNAQCTDTKGLKRLKGKMDWVLVDVPCSGTGTLRRNPDIAAQLNKEHIDELVEIQKTIVEKALTLLKPGGKLVYATCSLLALENEEQIAYFTKHFPLKLQGLPFKTLPISGGMDGFFGAVMVRSNS